jgi:hypothetical protein
MMYIAVVLKHLEAVGERPGAVTGKTREEAIKRAIKLRRHWCRYRDDWDSDYRIFVGELTTEVVEPIVYEEVKLG